MTDKQGAVWTDDELIALKRAYARGTLKVSYDGKSIEYGSAQDLLARINTLERAMGVAKKPIAGVAGFTRGRF
ncbi:MAG: hypothetical protein V6Z86_07295 [Hyphomicrobiales bacterium]